MQQSKIIRNTVYAQFIALVISSLTGTIGSLVDGMVIGRFLGVDSMAAFGIVSPLLVAFSVIGAVIANGSRLVFTRLIGQGKVKEAQSFFSLACVLSIGISTLSMILILLFAEGIVAMLGASGNAAELLPDAKVYLIGISFGLPAMNAMKILNGYLPIDSDRQLPVVASFVITGVDIVLDLLVALAFKGGTFGMGLATSISYYTAVGVLLTHFLRKNIILKLSFKGIPWKEAWKIIVKGLPIGVCRLAFTIRSTYLNRLLSLIATSGAIAAYSVYRQADDFLNCATIGMGSTVAIIAAVLLGEEDRSALRQLLTTSLKGSFAISLVLAIVTWIGAPWFAGIYIQNNPEALAYAVTAVRCYAIGLPLNALSMIYSNYIVGIGKTTLASITGLFSEAVFLVATATVLSRWTGANAVWFAFPITQVLMFLYYGAIVMIENHRLHIHRKGFWNMALLLPDTFDVAPEDSLSASIGSMDEVMGLISKVEDFCNLHHCDEKRKYLMSLSVEEMAGNVIQHGFTKDNKSHHLDIRVLKKQDDYILRMRDDCLIFDPWQQLRLYNEEDPLYHVGLRMISKIARDVQYTNLLKLNNLVVKL